MSDPSEAVLSSGAHSAPDALRILIVSTGKTGNTWIEALLSTLYHLPIVQVRGVWHGESFHFDRQEAIALGPRWIAHQHFNPHPELLEWARESGTHLVTTTRHPADALVSLFHYALNYDALNGANEPLSMPAMRTYLSASACKERTAPAMHDWEAQLAAFVREWFHGELSISARWLESGIAHPVRYEDLWLDPVTTLRELTTRIGTVPQERIERAVAQCDIGLMRSLAGNQEKFFRKGGIGEWRSAVPPAIVEILRSMAPYPSQFAALGYSLDPDDSLYARPIRPQSVRNPFHGVTRFENGVSIPPIVTKLFLALESSRSACWYPAERTEGPNSFYAWLNAPAEDDPGGLSAAQCITNLAAYLYRIRFDVQAMYPDLFGRDRAAFLTWYCQLARAEYALDEAFIAPVWESARVPQNGADDPITITEHRRRLWSGWTGLPVLRRWAAGTSH